MSRETNPIARFKRRPTLRGAVDAKCAECMGCTAKIVETGYRELIRECASLQCPLHSYRPYQGDTGDG